MSHLNISAFAGDTPQTTAVADHAQPFMSTVHPSSNGCFQHGSLHVTNILRLVSDVLQSNKISIQ